MSLKKTKLPSEFYAHMKKYHDLMTNKVREVLFVSSPYDAFIMEEDSSMSSKIINEYKGLNLSQPPRLTRTPSGQEALSLLDTRDFDMVITTLHLAEMDAYTLGLKIKEKHKDIPVVLLAHSVKGVHPLPENKDCSGIDKVFIWSGNADLLLSIIKLTEDRMNVDHDTRKSSSRVLILVEDNPVYYSSFLPIIYKEIVKQTQSVLEAGLNEDHRLLIMRTRPKILLANTYEEAVSLFQKYRPFLFNIISDTRIPRKGEIDPHAGFDFLTMVRKKIPDLPLLMMSCETCNREKSENVPAIFLDKNSPHLYFELHDFFLTYLGFGEFIFRMPDGTEIGRASNLRELEIKIAEIPDESLFYHSERNHFSSWVMSRAEVSLASAFRAFSVSDFEDADELRQYIASNIHALRAWRQKGIVSKFHRSHFDADIREFVKIGQGSLGGKARGLAFLSYLLHQHADIHKKFSDINIKIPKTMVICTDGFQDFVEKNNLRKYSYDGYTDDEVAQAFLDSKMPKWLKEDLESYLAQINYPLSIRSSSLLEDSQFQPYAGLYQTYMIPNNHPDLSVRLSHLIKSVKLVYASAYYEDPKAFSKNTSNQLQEEAMAVIVQEVVGDTYGDYYYPAVSGVAQSHNFYPVSYMKPEDGIAHIALGLGKTVVEGGKTLRFSPKHPNVLPQFSLVEDILKNAQRNFYALKINNYPDKLKFKNYSNLEKRDVDDAENEFPVKKMAGTYIPDENRIRDTWYVPGPKILTFAQVLKYNLIPLPEVLSDLIELGRKGMGCPIEIEFAVNLYSDKKQKGDLILLQIRPMVADEEQLDVQITKQDIENAFCRSSRALGNGKNETMADIVYVKPDDFSVESTVQIAEEINQMNRRLQEEKRPYLLVGPGRWGSSDRWLGIPVEWRYISGVGAIIELRNDMLKADPSQGSHFFQNITSLGIHYITVTEVTEKKENTESDFLDWEWINALPVLSESTFLRHVRLEKPMTLKINGRNAMCVITA